MGTIKKAQRGTRLSDSTLNAMNKSTTSSLDSATKAKLSSGVKPWTSSEQAKFKQEKSQIGAPPPGYKPKKKLKCGGKISKKK